MSKKPQKMWDKGVPLSEAFICFFGFPNHETDEEAAKGRSDYQLLGQPAELGEVDLENPEFFRFEPKPIEYRQAQRQKLRKQFCDSLCNHLKVGKLVALGKQIHPTDLTDPEVICAEEVVIEPDRQPDELTAADVIAGGHRIYYASWDDDVFVGRTTRYEDVRIYDPRYNLDGKKKKSAFPEDLQEKNLHDAPGRPSEEGTILEVFEKLKSESRINFLGTQIEAVKKIRSHIQNEMPDIWGDKGQGFSEKAIGNHIRDLFNAEKNKLKNI